jgi:hypothetical protein
MPVSHSRGCRHVSHACPAQRRTAGSVSILGFVAASSHCWDLNKHGPHSAQTTARICTDACQSAINNSVACHSLLIGVQYLPIVSRVQWHGGEPWMPGRVRLVGCLRWEHLLAAARGPGWEHLLAAAGAAYVPPCLDAAAFGLSISHTAGDSSC